MKKYIILFAAFITICNLQCLSLSVNGLRVNGLPNPSGIDDAPVFGWKLASDEHNVRQKEYEVTIYSGLGKAQPVWSSGVVHSDQSQHVKFENLDLHPETRYYWGVTVWDENGREAASDEIAYFDTGVMGDWVGAKWIKWSGDKACGFYMQGSVKDYAIEADISVETGKGGVAFAKAGPSFSSFQVDLSDEQSPKLQFVSVKNGKRNVLEEVALSAGLGLQPGNPFRLRIEAANSSRQLSAYVNGSLICTRGGYYAYTPIGFAHATGDIACYDNVKVEDLAAGTCLLHEDFSGLHVFDGGEQADSRLRVGSPDEEQSAWQLQGRPVQIIETDMTVVKGNPAIVFGWSAHRAYFVWQIVTEGVQKPVLRRGVRTFSDEVAYADVELKDLSRDYFAGAERHWRIECHGSDVLTFIDGNKVDSARMSRRPPLGSVGFYVASPNDEAFFDNLRVIRQYGPDREAVALRDDFQGFASPHFEEAEIVGGKLHAASAEGENLTHTVYADVPVFYTNVEIDKPVCAAKLFISALGVCDVWLNGQRVGHVQPDGSLVYDELKPGWTDFSRRVYYSSYDVTSLCRPGDNMLGAIVASGWANGAVSKGRYSDMHMSNSLIAKLVITYEDGTRQVVATDENWKSTNMGPLLSGEIYNGEYYNANYRYPWEGGNGEYPCVVATYNYPGELESMKGPYATGLIDHMLQPKTVTVYEGAKPGPGFGEINVARQITGFEPFALKKGQTALLDFGQNCAAVPIASVKGPKGARIVIQGAEILNDSGDPERGNDGPAGSAYIANLRSAKNRIYYVLSGGGEGERHQPSTTFMGYRYCEVTASDDVEILSFESMPLSSAHLDAGAFETDNELVNKLWSNVMWSQRSNMISIPTDCPQRNERAGWTADAQLFSMAGMYNADVAEFLRKWLVDVRDAQRQDGAFSNIVPVSLDLYGDGGWAEAGVIVPWNVYLMTGNLEVVRENYAAMERFMDWLSTQHSDGCQYSGGGISWGDWLASVATRKRYLSQCYYAWAVQLMAKMSALLSEADGDAYAQKAAEYAGLFLKIRDEIQQKHFDAEGVIYQTQTACVAALAFNLCVDEEQEKRVRDKLARLIEENGYCLNTGFLGTPYINRVLSQHGLADYAYDLLLQRKLPSWLYPIDHGATTPWERWCSYTEEDGIYHDEELMNSFNHYAYGAVVEWMYRDMAGINPCEDAPGFKKIVFSPSIDLRKSLPEGQERIRRAKASYQSIMGLIEAEWTIDDDNIYTYDITVPANSVGEVLIPTNSAETLVYEGVDLVENSTEITAIGYSNGRKSYLVPSGSYHFTTYYYNSSSSHSIDEVEISVYPNPVHDILHVDNTINVKGWKIISLSGLQMLSGVETVYGIDLSSLSRGVYVVIFDVGGKPVAKKVVKV